MQFLSEFTLMLFSSWLAVCLSPSSIAVYLAVVRSWHIVCGFSDLTANKPRLSRVLRGIHRSSSRFHPRRRPITKLILTALHIALFVFRYSQFWLNHVLGSMLSCLLWISACQRIYLLAAFLFISPFSCGWHRWFALHTGSPPTAFRICAKSQLRLTLSLGLRSIFEGLESVLGRWYQR